ncbi:MAG: 4Fe-4S ferredoxin [Christensenellales bacterium]
MHAVRNIRLCTKDCLCLYVCPTGATDTQNGQIDAAKCLDGCRACVDACASGAISLIPSSFPPQQEKRPEAASALRALARSKARQAEIASGAARASGDADTALLARALEKSNRLMAEDLMREAGYLLPQGEPARRLLQDLLTGEEAANFPREAVKRLLALL